MVKSKMECFNESLETGKKLISEDINKALHFFISLSEKFPNNDEVFFELGKIYYILQDYQKARIKLETVKNKKNNYHLNFLLAKTYKALNKNFIALKIFLCLYKQYKNNEIETEITNIFLINKKDHLAIKFLLKNNKKCSELDRIINNYVNYIVNKVANNDFNSVKNNILELIDLFDKYTSNEEYLKIKNILLNEYEIGNKKVVLKSKPRILTTVLTNKCNLKCKMCEVYKCEYEIKDSVVQQIINVLPYLETVGWLGGEIFLYKNFEKLLDAANKYKVKQSITTNGLLLTETIIKKLVTYNLDLTLSIDSIVKDTYETIREGAKFEVLLKNLELLKKYIYNSQVNLYINVVVSKWNENENFYNFIDFARKYNFSKITYSIDFHEVENKLLLDNFNNKFRDKILEAGKQNNITIVFTIPKFVSEEKDKGTNFVQLDNFCLRPWKSLVIDIDGKIRADCYCDFIYKLTGNEKLSDIWNSKEMIAFRNNMLQNGKSNCVGSCRNNVLDFQRFQI